ncbi:MAG TPA: diguanylate cyclase [Xanthomonadaceae bacterium]|nr:diguanylate cyclase [Xanthomonadaceae bacterium]
MRFSDSHALTTRLCAAFVLALGVLTLFGWAFGIPLLVRLRPDWTPMVVNTAIDFELAGIGLFAASLQGRLTTRIATLFGVLVALLAVEELCVLIFDISPALSLPQLHRPLQPDYPHPGRMAPNSAVCFLLFGAGLLASLRSRYESIMEWVQRAAIAVLAIGLLGVIGYSLRLEYLYEWTGVTRMAVNTGVGMVVLGIGLWNLAHTRAGVVPISDGTEVAGVYRAATLLLLVALACAGIGGFAFLQGQVEQQMRSDLMHMTVDRILMFSQVIEDRSGRAQFASDDDDLARQLRKLQLAPQDPTPLGALQTWALSLRANEFSSVSVETGGRQWQLDGDSARPTLTVALHGSYPGWLLWQDGYVLRRSLPVHDAAGEVGTLITEQRLRPLNIVAATTNRLGKTGEMGVCGADAKTLHCFPLRSSAQPFSTLRVVGGQPLPMDYAFRGKSGAIVALDYRQHRVLAAYGPVGDTGLALVVKRDIEEIYTPIRKQFQRIMFFLGALLLFGLWLMRRRLRPLLRMLEDSRAQARASSARFEAAVESHLDAFFVLECMRDPAGEIHDMRYVLINARGEEVLTRPRAEVLGRGMCELFPILRSDGMLASCAQVVATGEPAVLERCSVVRQTFWYHMQLVKLGDGVGLTVRDITAAHHATEEIRHRALHDPLTGVANRAGFESALTKAILEAKESGHVAALALLDLDDFKRINDSLGHAAGDQVLQHVATRLRKCIRPSDTVARLGGDEFVLVLPNINYPAGAEIVARKLIARIAQPIQVEGHTVAVTVSIGMSAYPHDGVDGAVLLKSADHAMYRAKRAGRNDYALHDTAPD